jgi:RND family efflux transporter MFP subunit
VAVRRGAITEVLQVAGRVAGQEEVPLSITTPGRVQGVLVKPGQGVTEGQMLLETDGRLIQRDLSAARARMESDTLRLRQAQAQAQARQADENRSRQLNRTSAQRALSDAEAVLVRARAELEKVRAGASAADREGAEGAVAVAQAAVAKAETDLGRLNGGPNSAEVAAAEQALTSARLTQQRAEAELARLQRGAEGPAVRTAELAVGAAQNEQQRAQADLDALVNKDPRTISTAEREVDRARVFLQAAESTQGPGRDVSVANARLALREAEERLAAQRQPAPAWQVDIARRNVDRARITLEGAQEQLNAARQGPDQLAIDTAQAAVDSAKLGVQNAEARLATVQAGAGGDAVAAAQTAFNAARSALSVAESRRAELLSHPTDAELKEAQARLNSAQAAFDRVRAETESQPSAVDLTSFDLQLLEQAVESARSQVETIERELAATKLRAPFAGTVISVLVRSGDPIEPGQAVIVMSKTADAVVRADLNESAAGKVQAGQGVTVVVEGKNGASMPATIAEVITTEAGLPVAVVQLQVPEGMPRPAFGTNVQLAVSVQAKENVLLIPQKAVRTAGSRRYVEYVDGTNRRIADVQTGIASGADVEVLSGLTEGQTVLVTTQ